MGLAAHDTMVSKFSKSKSGYLGHYEGRFVKVEGKKSILFIFYSFIVEILVIILSRKHILIMIFYFFKSSRKYVYENGRAHHLIINMVKGKSVSPSSLNSTLLMFHLTDYS